MRFWKTHAVGNDFVLIHGDAMGIGADYAALAIAACHRRTGIGADGLLVMEGTTLRMFNPDGTEDFCGNGLRCAAVHAHAMGWIGERATLVHHRIPVEAEITGPSRSRVTLQAASFAPEDVPTVLGNELFMATLEIDDIDLQISTLSTGSAHTVIFVDQLPGDELFFDLSPRIEHHPWFPERTSVMWALPTSDHSLRLRIWERGAGETLGCGTGTAATAVVWSRLTGVEGPIRIENPGGAIEVRLADWQSPLSLESEVHRVAEGTFAPLALIRSRESVGSPAESSR